MLNMFAVANIFNIYLQRNQLQCNQLQPNITKRNHKQRKQMEEVQFTTVESPTPSERDRAKSQLIELRENYKRGKYFFLRDFMRVKPHYNNVTDRNRISNLFNKWNSSFYPHLYRDVFDFLKSSQE